MLAIHCIDTVARVEAGYKIHSARGGPCHVNTLLQFVVGNRDPLLLVETGSMETVFLVLVCFSHDPLLVV